MLVSWVKFGSCWGLIRFMWVSRDKFWSSWGLKQDLHDSFTFCGHSMLVFWDQFGSCWGLKPDLDDSFTFLSRFMKSEAEPEVLGRNRLLGFRGYLTRKWSQIGAQNHLRIQHVGGSFLDLFVDHFWVLFEVIFGTFLGPNRAKKEPRWAQEGHEELQSTKKYHFQKVSFYSGKTILFTSWRLPRWA